MSQNTNNLTEDYLDEDKPLRHMVKKQNWCVISMLTPNSFPESKREQYKDQKILGIKIRGVFEEYEEAQKRADTLQKLDKYHNIFVGEVGKWLPFDVDTTNMGVEDQVYREKSLNEYMKSYKDCLNEEEKEEKSRKQELLQGANVVTNKHDAPEITGLGQVDDVQSVIHKEQNKKIKEYSSVDSKVEKELEDTREEKEKLQSELNENKESLKNLEDKLTKISQIYNELKSK